MKKVLLILMFLVATSLESFAYAFEVDGIYYNITSEEKLECEVTYKSWNAKSYSGIVSINSKVSYNSKEYSVTSIGNWAFYDCSGLTSVTIPNSVTSIGDEVFRYCSGLTSVTIPNSVNRIGNWAFDGCDGLTSVTIPNSVTSIGDYAFYNCSGLTSVTIPNSVTSIGLSAFSNCSGLTSVTIPNSVTRIGSSAFFSCSGLTSVTIPNSVTSIGNYAFCYCSGLTSVTIPNSVTSIGFEAFYKCSGLTSVTIPNSVTSIGGEAFYNCSGLTDIINYATTPQPINYSVFSSYGGTLHVPYGCKAAYEAADFWKNFTIVEMEGPTPSYFSPVATDGETVQYLYNVEAKAFVLGANNWGVRASVDIETGYKFKVKANGDGTYTLNDYCLASDQKTWTWSAMFADDGTGIWVDNADGANVNKWVITPIAGENNVYEITNPSAAQGKLGVKTDLSDTRLYIKNKEGYSTRWAFMSEEQYQQYLSDNAEEIGKILDERNTISLAAQKELIEGTNIYDATGYNAYVQQYNDYLSQFEAGTLKEKVVNPTTPTNWHASTAYNFLLTPWTIGGESCNNFDKALWVNTWSTEGEKDGSNFLIPFIEYWTNGDKSLGANKIATKVTDLEPNSSYKVTILARVCVKDNTTETPKGISMTVGDGESVNLCEGQQVGDTQMYLAEFTASGSVDSDGNLNINIDVAEDNNVQWLAFKNVKYTKLSNTESDTDISNIANTIYFDNVESAADGELTLSVKMKNTIAATGFQLDLYLPEGVSVVQDADGYCDVVLSTERTTTVRTNTFDSAIQKDGSLRVLAASTKNYAFSGNDGEVCTIKLKLNGDLEPGNYPLILRNIELTNNAGGTWNVDYLKRTLTIVNYVIGDANGDTRVSVGDFSAIASHIMGVTPEGFIAKAADVNSDNRVSVGDLSAVVSMIMNGGAASAKVRSANTVAQENSIFAHAVSAAPGNEVDLVINLNNSDAVTAMQFDVCLPEGMSIVENGTSLSAVRASHTNTFDYGMMADNKFRVLAASTTNALIDGNDGEIVRIRVRIDESVSDGEYPVIIRNAEVADNAGHSFLCADKSSLISVSGNVTGIDELSSGTSAVYYDLNGISDTKMHNGINIIRSADGTMKKVNKKQF